MELEELVGWATAGLNPDLTVLLDLPVAVAAARRHGGVVDKLESEPDSFHQRVADGYRTLAGEDGDRWLVVDAAGTVDSIASSIWKAVEVLAGPAGPPQAGR